MKTWLANTGLVLSIAHQLRFWRVFWRVYRDWIWTIVFWRCAVTVVARPFVLRARIRYRIGGNLVVRFAHPAFEGVEDVEVPFADRGIAWAAGWEGEEVDALQATVALS